MFDIDAGYAPTLRLVAPSTSHDRLSHTIDRLHREHIEGPASAEAEALRVAQRDVEAAHSRWIDAYVAWQAAVAQARPIPVGGHKPRYFKGLEPSVSAGDINTLVSNGATVADCRMADGHLVASIKSPTGLTDNDFWTNRHCVMTGPQPIIARATGHLEPLKRN